MIVTDQKISEMIPYTLSALTGTGCGSLGVEDGLNGVDRAGADVAEDDAQRADDDRRPVGGRAARAVGVSGGGTIPSVQ